MEVRNQQEVSDSSTWEEWNLWDFLPVENNSRNTNYSICLVLLRGLIWMYTNSSQVLTSICASIHNSLVSKRQIAPGTMLVALCGTQSFTYQDAIPSTTANLVAKMRQTCKVRDSLRFRYWVKSTETYRTKQAFLSAFCCCFWATFLQIRSGEILCLMPRGIYEGHPHLQLNPGVL